MEPSTPSAHPPGKLNCPQCGGEATPDTVRCGYCGSSLATVACPSCFGSLFVGMPHCPWCGAAASPPAGLEDSPGPCPRCREALQSLTIGQVPLAECRRCGGLWVDNARFEQICADRETQEAVLGEGRDDSPAAGQAQEERFYIPCPRCLKLMHRIHFAGCSGIVVDRCKLHGTWFDHRELQRIISFIRDGGLKKARDREKDWLREESERLKEEKRKLEEEHLRMLLTSTRPGGPGDYDHNESREADTLLRALASLWRQMK